MAGAMTPSKGHHTIQLEPWEKLSYLTAHIGEIAIPRAREALDQTTMARRTNTKLTTITITKWSDIPSMSS